MLNKRALQIGRTSLRQMILSFGIAICMVTAPTLAKDVSASRITRRVSPRATDRHITKALLPHYVVRNPSVSRRNQLVVFFPGTKANPLVYRFFVNTAADLGYHAIGLSYPNNAAINTLCGSGTDLNCYSDIRLETLDGVNRSPLVNVNRANSIENRLIKLLLYLIKHDPQGHWGQFLRVQFHEATKGINWPQIVSSGHSQGGGFAGIVGRYHSVARVIMFNAYDYNANVGQLANWLGVPSSTPDATPPERYFGFGHYRDEFILFPILTGLAWPAYGMTMFGPLVDVGVAAPPYHHSHTLYTNHNVFRPDPSSLKFHNSTVLDLDTPLTLAGAPVFERVWRYLLTAKTSARSQP